MRSRVVEVGFCLALTACTVDAPPDLDDGFWVCATAMDCGPDQGCAEGNVYSADFCRPACDRDDPSSCPDGVCTASGACLERCRFDPDGTPVGCASPDFTCVRTDALRDLGVCFPVDGCSRTAECPVAGGVEQLCLNDALGLPADMGTGEVRFDNLYCTAASDAAGRCPMGYLNFAFVDEAGESQVACYAPCALGDEGPFCPPSTTCFLPFGELLGLPDQAPCVPGAWGLPCEDDTQCLIGSCLPVGDSRRACTETCAWADENVGGCGSLEGVSDAFGVTARMTCEGVAGQDTCVPRYDLLSLCDPQLECVGGNVECTLVGLGGDLETHVCLRECVTDGDCVAGTGGEVADYRCVAIAGGGICNRKRSLGARCSEDLDCREGVCCDVGEGLGQCRLGCT